MYDFTRPGDGGHLEERAELAAILEGQGTTEVMMDPLALGLGGAGPSQRQPTASESLLVLSAQGRLSDFGGT